MISSTPGIEEFKPLPQQLEIIKDIRTKFDYGAGTHEVFLSGSVGSAKSLVLAHIVVTHCLFYPGAVFGIGRLALPRLKETLCQKIREHLYDSGIDYKYNETKGNFSLPGGSKIIAFSWSDKNFQKFRSYELSGMAFEELAENKTPDAYNEAYMRVGRVSHVPEKLVISATNPDSPSHWCYNRFIQNSNPLVHVYYSKTTDNPYLPESYIENLRESLDAKMARRMIDGEWLEITRDVVYYAYSQEKNYRDESYRVDERLPINVCFDFNIGEGKPLSVGFFQYDGSYHIFNEVVVEGQRTEDALDEAHGRGLFDYKTRYIINGDATGKARSTNSRVSDYDIIDNYLANARNNNKQRINYTLDVPKSNPPIRTRHNTVNGVLCNSKGQVRAFVYKDAPTVDEGFRLTKLREGGHYLEDDSDRFQHITTAIGYGIWKNEQNKRAQRPRAISR